MCDMDIIGQIYMNWVTFGENEIFSLFFCFDTDWSFTQVYCEKLKSYNLRSFSMSKHPYQNGS